MVVFIPNAVRGFAKVLCGLFLFDNATKGNSDKEFECGKPEMFILVLDA